MSKRRRKGKPSANGQTPQALKPQTQPPEYPGAGRITLLWMPPRIGGVRVTEDTALTYSAVWGCVRVITEGLAQLPLGVYRRRPAGGRDPMPDHPVDWMSDVQANPETPAFQFRETLIANALLWGNGYAEIERDAAGRPVWLWQITPDRVTVARDDFGRIVYDVRNDEGPNTVLDAEDVFHLKGLGFDGLVGYSVIRYAARAIGAAIAADEQSVGFFENDSTPGGFLKTPRRLTDVARKNLIESWERRHGGPKNRRRLAILEEGLEWQQTGMPPDDAQLIEQRQFSPIEICRFFRVQPHKIFDLTRATYSNIEEQSREHVTDTLMPWAVRWEKEGNIKLFGRTNRGTLYLRHNFNAVMRGNAQTRSAFYTAMADRGVFSVNDILELEDMNPIGPDGDKRFVQVNMQLLEKAGEGPPPGQKPPPGQESPQGGGGSTQDDGGPARQSSESVREDRTSALLTAHTPVLAEALGRCLSRCRKMAESALKRFAGDREKFEAWANDFFVDHDRYASRALTPACDALAMLAGGSSGQAALGAFLVDELKALRQALVSSFDCGEVIVEPVPDLSAHASRLARQVVASVEEVIA